MAWKTNILVVANVTADSDELLRALDERAERSPTSYYLVVPTRGAGESARTDARGRLQAALSRARDRGLEIEGAIGAYDPVLAVSETFDPRRYDEIIVSTLPVGSSRWLQLDLPHRIGRVTGVPVRHVVSHEPRRPARSVTVPPREPRGVLSPLTPLTWGGRAASRRVS